MPFLDHLEELRWRLLKSLLAIAIGTAVGWFVVQQLDILDILKRPIAPFLPDGRLVFTSPTEPLMLTLKLALAVGLVLSSPVVVYQAWAFLAPALYEKEKRVIVPAFTVGIGLFLAGAVACYLWVLPAAIRVLFGFQSADLTPMITIDRYFGFAIQLMLAFGVVAELPLVVTILAAFGVITPQFLIKQRRYAIVISAIVAAFLTPPDALSMTLMLVPMLLLYEISILCAWLMARRRARAEAARSAALIALLLAAVAGAGNGQQRPPPPDTGRVADTLRLRNQPVDTAKARLAGLPTGPTRTFPPADAVIDSLLKLRGYRITRYVAETLLVEGDSQIIYFRGAASLDRDGTRLEADSVRYRESSCRLDAAGDPRLFDQGTVLVGDRMRYDTCERRGLVLDALTDFEQGGATWFMRGNMGLDAAADRLYGAGSRVTTCEIPVPHYHFAAREVMWINKDVMVARPAVLYIRDVPILWLPFIVNDLRRGRRSGVLVPSIGLDDLVRPSRSHRRSISNLGYYFALNDYTDLELRADWLSGRTLRLDASSRYRWLDRFITGGVAYSRYIQLDGDATSSHIRWNHQQSFSSRTQLSASIDYATRASVIPQNTVDPYIVTAELGSNASFTKRFSWGTLSLGGTRRQNLQNDQVTQTFPNVSLTPVPIDLTSWLTWSPGFTLQTNQAFRISPPVLIPVPGAAGPDTLRHFADTRNSSLTFATPLRIGRWSWANSFAVSDRRSTERREFLIPDSTAPGGVRRALYGETFETAVNWETGISLPQLFSRTWKLGPSVSIVNTTSGPFMIRNQFTGGEFVQQGKRLQFGVGLRPTVFGFFPGFGPLQRIRHSISPIVDYRYAPGAGVPEPYSRAIDPEGRNPNARRDPQQTITFGLSQNFEAKLRPPPGDTASAGRKVQLLSIQTSGISYNFEQAKQVGRTGWVDQRMSNSFRSELVPGFDLGITHNLWDGQVGSDTARFDPFLESVSASFSITPGTLRGIGALFGLVRRGRPEPTTRPDADTLPAGEPPLQGGVAGPPGGGRLASGAFRGPRSDGFSLAMRYSGTRVRGDPTPSAGGRQVLSLDMNFSPTPNWRAVWSTTYDVETQRFGQHVVSFQRDMHRWQASFSFVQAATGSFAFRFNVSLRDQPDIHFDYDQQSLGR
jgi:Tat protein translocase TatC